MVAATRRVGRNASWVGLVIISSLGRSVDYGDQYGCDSRVGWIRSGIHCWWSRVVERSRPDLLNRVRGEEGGGRETESKRYRANGQPASRDGSYSTRCCTLGNAFHEPAVVRVSTFLPATAAAFARVKYVAVAEAVEPNCHDVTGRETGDDRPEGAP